MSYEGYEQWLCATGHLFQFDCYEIPHIETYKCPHCGSGIVWTNNVDITNGSYDSHGNRIDGRVQLVRVEDGDITGKPTFHMPKKGSRGRYLGVPTSERKLTKPVDKKPVQKATPIQQEFLVDLLKLCRKYRININNAHMEMYYGSDVEKPVHLDVEVTGAWDIRQDYDAVVAHEVEEVIKQSWRVKGTDKTIPF